MRTCFIIAVIVFLSGCVSTYRNQVVQPPTSRLDRSKGVYISTPKDGWYGKIEYKNSGKMTASAVKAAFARFSNNTYVSDKCLGRECLKIIPTDQYGYYVEPEILHWEDRATEWSGIRDRMEIKISVYDAKSGAEIASSVLTGRSKWATFGGDHPQDLLPEPVNRYVESLY
jgi:hypothetical protein